MFKVKPKITSVSPNPASVGSTVTLTGTAFLGIKKVLFTTSTGTVKGSVSSGSYLQIKVKVPNGAISGNIKVTTTGGSATIPITIS